MQESICTGKSFLFAFFFLIGSTSVFSQKSYKVFSSAANKAQAILNWTGKMNEEYPGVDFYHMVVDELYPRMLNLFADEYFVPVFGEPFDEMNKAKRMQIGRSFRSAWSSNKWGPQFTWQRMIDRPFILENGSFSYREVADFLTKRRELKKEYDKIYSLLSEKNNEITTNDLIKYKQLVAKDFSGFWPSDVKKITDLISINESLANERHLENILPSILKSGNTYQSLISAKQFYNQNQNALSHVSKEVRDDIMSKVNDKIKSNLSALMEKERTKINDIPPGEKGIIPGNEWYKTFLNKYYLFNDNKTVSEVVDFFLNRRIETLAMLKPSLETKIANATGNKELAQLEKKYLDYLPPQNEIAKEIALKINNRETYIKEQERQRNEKIKREKLEKWSLAESRGPKFSTEGLNFEKEFRNIFRGDFLDIPFDRDEMMFAILFDTYVKAYGSECDASLPSDKIMLTERKCDRWWVTTRNGVEVDRECTHWFWDSLYIYASPEMYDAKIVVDNLQNTDALRTVIRMLNQKHPIGNALTLLQNQKAAEADMPALIKMNGCASPALMRFQENLRLFALNKQPVRLEGAPTDNSSENDLSKDQNFKKLADDLIYAQSKKWAMNRYLRGSVSNVIISSRDDQGRPSEIKATYRYQGFSGQSSGSVRITFNDDGLPKCLYFFDFPYTCRTADRRTVAEYAKGDYQKQ